jgi:hypothetical protein
MFKFSYKKLKFHPSALFVVVNAKCLALYIYIYAYPIHNVSLYTLSRQGLLIIATKQKVNIYL